MKKQDKKKYIYIKVRPKKPSVECDTVTDSYIISKLNSIEFKLGVLNRTMIDYRNQLCYNDGL